MGQTLPVFLWVKRVFICPGDQLMMIFFFKLQARLTTESRKMFCNSNINMPSKPGQEIES